MKFNQDFNGIFQLARYRCRGSASDPTMARHVQQYLDTLASRPHGTTVAEVRECIYMMLPSGLCSAHQVARRLGIDRRTIHRHLAKEGETFSSLMDSVRTELVTRYVENRDRPLVTIAELLGFSALSAFSRWFHSRFGCTVSQWRAEQSAATRPKSSLREISGISPLSVRSGPKRHSLELVSEDAVSPNLAQA